MKIPTFYSMNLTEWVIILAVTLLSIYDVVAKIMWGDNATISFTLQRLCERDYKVGVMAALIFAHIFLTTYRHSP